MLLNETSSDGSVTPWLFVVATTWGYMDEGAHALNGFGQFGGRDVVLLKLTLDDGTKVWARQVRIKLLLAKAVWLMISCL